MYNILQTHHKNDTHIASLVPPSPICSVQSLTSSSATPFPGTNTKKSRRGVPFFVAPSPVIVLPTSGACFKCNSSSSLAIDFRVGNMSLLNFCGFIGL